MSLDSPAADEPVFRLSERGISTDQQSLNDHSRTSRRKRWTSLLSGSHADQYEKLPGGPKIDEEDAILDDDEENTRSQSRSFSLDFCPLPKFLHSTSSTAAAADDEILTAGTHIGLFLIFFLLGVGMLFPWNVFINATDYFKMRLSGSIFMDNHSNFFSLGFMLSNLIWLAIALYLQRQSNSFLRTLIALVVNGCVFLACTLLTRLPGIEPTTFFYVTLLMCVICGGSTAFLQNGVFALASGFDPVYTQAVMSGQGLAGAAVAIAQMLTLWIRPKEDEASESDQKLVFFSSMIYFGFATAVIIACLGATLSLRTLSRRLHKVRVSTSPSVFGNEKDDDDDEEQWTQDSLLVEAGAEEEDFIDSMIPLLSHAQVFRRILPLGFSVFMVFMITLTVFPSLISLIQPMQMSPSAKLFTPLAFLTFALGDWFGKSLPGFPVPSFLTDRRWTQWQACSGSLKDQWILSLSLLRLLLIPFLLSCNVVLHGQGGRELERRWPLLFPSDIAFFMGLAVLAVSNGWLGSLAMMHGPSKVRAAEDKELAGTMMVFCLTTGLAVGSLLSFGVRTMLCQCNPFVD